jgi:V8-like Glu-specific endopeptidase
MNAMFPAAGCGCRACQDGRVAWRRPIADVGPGAAAGCGCRACQDRRMDWRRPMMGRRPVTGTRAMVAAEHEALWRLHGLVEEEDTAVIGPTDNRVQQVATKSFPWNTICHMCRAFPGVPCSGCTGTLIAADTVLTAGHCLWSLHFNKPPQSILVAPGRVDATTTPYGSIAASQIWVPRGFINGGPDRSTWDFGVMRLVRPFSTINRFMPMRALDGPALEAVAARYQLTVAGYPTDRPMGTMWRHTERLKKVTPRRLFYSVSTCPGHSGSAVTTERGHGPEIIGVHTTGVLDNNGKTYGCAKGVALAPANLMNSGVRLTDEIIDAILHPTTPRQGAAAMVALL